MTGMRSKSKRKPSKVNFIIARINSSYLKLQINKKYGHNTICFCKVAQASLICSKIMRLFDINMQQLPIVQLRYLSGFKYFGIFDRSKKISE
jgi:hypothetical protein